MKIGGADPSTMSREEVLVLPRGNESIVFRAVGVPDYDEFEKLCPEPRPPAVLAKEGKKEIREDSGWLEQMENYGKQRLAWMVIKSLEPSDIEWDTVQLDAASTWNHWTDDLRKAGFSQVEVNRVSNLVMAANCLDEAKLEAARQNFLRGQQAV